jgi:hypothetical protein
MKLELYEVCDKTYALKKFLSFDKNQFFYCLRNSS